MFYKVYADEFYSLVFESITAYIYISDMMLKVSKKERSDLEKNRKVLAKEKNSLAEKKHSMHAFMILTTVSCTDFSKSHTSIDICLLMFPRCIYCHACFCESLIICAIMHHLSHQIILWN